MKSQSVENSETLGLSFQPKNRFSLQQKKKNCFRFSQTNGFRFNEKREGFRFNQQKKRPSLHQNN